MRRITYAVITVLFFLLCFCGNASAVGYTIVSHCVGASNASPSSCTLTASANTLLVASGWFFGVGTDSFTDTFSLSFARTNACEVHRGGSSNDLMVLAWAYTGSNSGSDTVTVTAASGFADLSVVDYDTGLDAGQPSTVMSMDPTTNSPCAVGTAGGPTTIASASFTTTAANTLIVGFGESDNGTAVTAGSGYTLSITPPNSIVGDPVWLPVEDMLGVTATSYTATIGVHAAGVWSMNAVAFPTRSPTVPRHGTGFY